MPTKTYYESESRLLDLAELNLRTPSVSEYLFALPLDRLKAKSFFIHRFIAPLFENMGYKPIVREHEPVWHTEHFGRIDCGELYVYACLPDFDAGDGSCLSYRQTLEPALNNISEVGLPEGVRYAVVTDLSLIHI